MPARQCPRCRLRFAGQADLRDHLATDHGVAPEELDHLQPAAARVGTRVDPDPQARAARRRDG